MEDEMHGVVNLLLARMKSHPEEFVADVAASGSREDRWWHVLREVREYGNEAERNAVAAAIREIKLRHAHQVMMDELCNGDERRRKEQEEYEQDIKRYQAQSMLGAGASAGSVSTATQLRLGKETLDETTLNKLKKAIGI